MPFPGWAVPPPDSPGPARDSPNYCNFQLCWDDPQRPAFSRVLALSQNRDVPRRSRQFAVSARPSRCTISRSVHLLVPGRYRLPILNAVARLTEALGSPRDSHGRFPQRLPSLQFFALPRLHLWPHLEQKRPPDGASAIYRLVQSLLNRAQSGGKIHAQL